MKLSMSLVVMAMALVVLVDSAFTTVTSDLTLPSYVVENMVIPTELSASGTMPDISHSGSGSILAQVTENDTMLRVKAFPTIQVAGLLTFDGVTAAPSVTVIPKRDATAPVSSGNTTTVEALTTPSAPSSDAIIPGMGRPNTPTTITHTVSITSACGSAGTSAMETVTAMYQNMTTAFWTLHYPGMSQAMLISTASTSTSTTVFETSSFNDSTPTTASTMVTEPVKLTTVGMDPIYTITVVQEGTFTVEGGRRIHWATTAEQTMTDTVWPFSASSVTIPAVATFPAETGSA
ncbi:uncharacterized protein IWZ02DRAFT_518628 [Phyllosticta citriasiana]|uniref:uncharacterized protein n=1 Tax=Phyllosticta citriasiana TaxID=595635 RepID=UPI0030FDA3F6